jgi:hypothetical protein
MAHARQPAFRIDGRIRSLSRFGAYAGLRRRIISDILFIHFVSQPKGMMMLDCLVPREIDFFTPTGCGPKWVRLFFLCKEQVIL